MTGILLSLNGGVMKPIRNNSWFDAEEVWLGSRREGPCEVVGVIA